MKTKLSIIACMVACVTFLSADEFFEAGTKIGGYGELHWNQQYDGNGNQSKNQLDFHRFIIYYGYNWTEEWSFKSELELEHNTVIPGDTDTDGNDTDVTKTGELELEQAYINYHAGNWGFQGGVILPSVGLLNEYHEPPLFLSVERPDYNKRIIPTTWFGNGFAFYGKFRDFNWRIAMLEDLNGDKISDGIRSARGKGFKTSAESWTKNFSASYTGINGLRLGGSLTMNDAPTSEVKAETFHIWEYIQTEGVDTEDINDDMWEWNDTIENIEAKSAGSVGVNLTEFNLKYDANNIVAVFEYGNISYENNPDGYDSSSGYYLDLGYNIGSLLGCDGKLIPWLRLSNVARADDVADKTYSIFRTGLTYKPIDNVVFKADYGTVKKGTSEDKEINIGIGYNF